MTQNPKDHHWGGVTPDPVGQWGFIYCITHLPTGKKYIGKKQYRKSSGKTKRRCMSVNLPAFKEYHWVENDWKYYSGSSKYLREFKKGTKASDWEHEILTQCTNSMDLHYQEIEYLVHNKVLTLVDDEGEYVFFNRSIPGIKFRPPSVVSDETRDKMSNNGSKKRAEDGSCLKCGENDWFLNNKPNRQRPTPVCKSCERERSRKRYLARKKAEKLKDQPRMKDRRLKQC